MKRNNFLKLGIGIPLLGMFSFKTFSKEKVIKKNPVIVFTLKILEESNVGLYVINDKANVVEKPDYSATVTWKLVYQFKRQSRLDAYNTRGLCNVLTDGWIHWCCNTKEEMCEWLNNNIHKEKFRILTKEELYYIIENRTNQKQIVRHVI